jgi:hypothetical protein
MSDRGKIKGSSWQTYVNTVHTLGKLALKFDIFWREFGVYVLVVRLLHLA